jgi:transcriptional regulator with XRE-family HTH domain
MRNVFVVARTHDHAGDVELQIDWTARPAEIGGRIRAARLRAGLTQEQLGLRAGVSRNHVHLLETGRSSPTLAANPRLRMVYELAAALRVTPLDLLPGDANMVPSERVVDSPPGRESTT